MPEILYRYHHWHRICAFFGLIGSVIFIPQTAVATDTAEEFEGQETLFLLEEAYTQEKGEWQIGASISQNLDRSDERIWELEVEYGVTGRLQLFVELPQWSMGPLIAAALVIPKADTHPNENMLNRTMAPDGSWSSVSNI